MMRGILRYRVYALHSMMRFLKKERTRRMGDGYPHGVPKNARHSPLATRLYDFVRMHDDLEEEREEGRIVLA